MRPLIQQRAVRVVPSRHGQLQQGDFVFDIETRGGHVAFSVCKLRTPGKLDTCVVDGAKDKKTYDRHLTLTFSKFEWRGMFDERVLK